ncbi:unnamed protein product, partial [Callosobruchus maculatus]
SVSKSYDAYRKGWANTNHTIGLLLSGTIHVETYPVIRHSHQIFAVMRRVPGCFRFFLLAFLFQSSMCMYVIQYTDCTKFSA